MTRRNRRSFRLKGYDYSQPGGYFVTVVTKDRVCLFGDVVGDKMHLNDAGAMVLRVWENLSSRFPTVEPDVFVVMPNHIHGILIAHEPVGASLVGAQEDGSRRDRAAILGDVIGAYKSVTTVEYSRGVKTCGWLRFSGRLWQRNYYEHIIRSESELARAREYIANNPLQWALDKENPDVASRAGSPSQP